MLLKFIYFVEDTCKVYKAVVAQGHKVATVNATVVGSIPTRGNEIFNIFIFHALVNCCCCSKCDAEFHQSTRIALRIWRKVANECILMEDEVLLNTRFPGALMDG